MSSYDVAVACTVDLHRVVSVEAGSQEEAEKLVADEIEDDPWNSRAWTDGGSWAHNWQAAENLRVR